MNIGQLLTKSARTFPEKPRNCIRIKGIGRMPNLTREPTVWANGLNKLGVQQGDNVAVLMYNCPEMLESMFACFKAGCGTIPINFRLHPREFAFIINHSEAKVVIISPEFSEAIIDIRDDIPQVSCIISVPEAQEPFFGLRKPCYPQNRIRLKMRMSHPMTWHGSFIHPERQGSPRVQC